MYTQSLRSFDNQSMSIHSKKQRIVPKSYIYVIWNLYLSKTLLTKIFFYIFDEKIALGNFGDTSIKTSLGSIALWHLKYSLVLLKAYLRLCTAFFPKAHWLQTHRLPRRALTDGLGMDAKYITSISQLCKASWSIIKENWLLQNILIWKHEQIPSDVFSRLQVYRFWPGPVTHTLDRVLCLGIMHGITGCNRIYYVCYIQSITNIL